MKCQKRKRFALLVALLATCPVGCASLSNKSGASLADKMPWSNKDAKPKPYPNPVKMAVTWTPDTLVQTGRTPTRGFGGRIYFYDGSAHAVPVEGTLVIHGYEEGVDPTKTPPKRFEFTPEQFTRHYSQSDLGASYSLWVPWDAVGGDMTKISLVATFKSTAEETTPIQSVPATVILPGRKTEAQIAGYQTPLSPQFEQWKKAASATTPPKSGLTTTTIQRRSPTPRQVPETTWQRPTNRIVQGSTTPAVDVPMAPKLPAMPQALPKSESQILPTSGWAPVQK